MTEYEYTYDIENINTGQHEIYLLVYLDDDTTEASNTLDIFVTKLITKRFLMPYDVNNKKIPMGIYTSADVFTLNAGEESDIINKYGNAIINVIAIGSDAYIDFGITPETSTLEADRKMKLVENKRESFIVDTNWKIGVQSGTIEYHVSKLG